MFMFASIFVSNKPSHVPGYWHQVRSFGYMNSAIAIWFSTLDSFDEAGCDEKIFDFVPMNTVPVIWRYSGKLLM